MPRLTNINDVLFPVDEHPVFINVHDKSGEKRLTVPGKKALVNRNSNSVLGIVSRGYRLVSNKEALDLAYKCCRTVFPETQPAEWGVNAVDAPSTAGYCHIDLVHNSTALDFDLVLVDQRPEVFGPFIRVTNSFNGARALGFDIGFYRKICKNGLIVPDTIIRFKFTHVRREIGDTVDFEIAHQRLAIFKSAFAESLKGLRNCTLPRLYFERLVCGALQIRQPQNVEPDSRGAAEWRTLWNHLSEMSTRYAAELGENAYAGFNAITEFASHPPENRCVHRDRHSLQRLAGSWMTSFNEICRKPGFSIANYLQEVETTQLELVS